MCMNVHKYIKQYTIWVSDKTIIFQFQKDELLLQMIIIYFYTVEIINCLNFVTNISNLLLLDIENNHG